MYESPAREILALTLLKGILHAEKTDIDTASRAHTLDLLRDILDTIDGKRVVREIEDPNRTAAAVVARYTGTRL